MTGTNMNSQPFGAMALMDKYSALHRGIETARRQLLQYTMDQESLQQRILQLQDERAEMERSIQEATTDALTLNDQVHEALSLATSLEHEQHTTRLQLTETKRQYAFLQSFVEDQRQTFLQQGRDFRTACKRMRLAASAVGDDLAPFEAFLQVNAKEQPDEISDYQDDDHDHCSKQNSKEETLELELVTKQHIRAKQARDEAERAFQLVLKQNEACLERCANRTKRNEQLQLQLERVQKDIVPLEQQLLNLQRETRDMRQRQNLEKGATPGRKRRNGASLSRRNSVTPSPHSTQVTRQSSTNNNHHPSSLHPRNPYAKPAAAPFDQNDTENTIHQQSHEQTKCQRVVKDRAWNSSAQQHPHRAGRIRVDRQFGTALEIMAGRDDDSENPYKTIGNGVVSSLVDDEDDDDEFLSFVAFTSKS